ncbi:MAG TPA: hypothetical protein VNA20_14675 [Frankiaceae bacterium]|nr:hypothetical protein [Frankiaceae bacterium]
MKRRLSLKAEHLAELSTDELSLAVAGGADSSYTGRPGCVLSYEPPCVTFLCTALCNVG